MYSPNGGWFYMLTVAHFSQRGPLACDYAVDGSVSKSHCSDGKLRVIHQSLPQLVAGAVLTAPVVTIRMTTLDYPSEEDLKVELENLPVHANGGSEESSGKHASLAADITAAVLAALDAKAKDAAGRAAQTWRGQWTESTPPGSVVH